MVSKKHYEAANSIFLICKLRILRYRVNTESPKATLLGFNPDEIDVTLDVEVDLLNLMLIFFSDFQTNFNAWFILMNKRKGFAKIMNEFNESHMEMSI